MKGVGATTTKTGLKVESALDTRSYQKGIKVSKAAMKCLDIIGDQFHPEWNYTQGTARKIVAVIVQSALIMRFHPGDVLAVTVSRSGRFCADRDKRIVRRPSPPASSGFLGGEVGRVPWGATPGRNDDLILGALRHATGRIAGRPQDVNGGSSRSRRARLAFCALRAGWPWFTGRAGRTRRTWIAFRSWSGLPASCERQGNGTHQDQTTNSHVFSFFEGNPRRHGLGRSFT
jgi:hypothetical protein